MGEIERLRAPPTDEEVEHAATAMLDRQYGTKRRPAPHIMALLMQSAREDARVAIRAFIEDRARPVG